MKVTILPSQQFDQLPYMGIRYSFGVADTKKNEAFIRKTGDPKEDLDSLIHEINEGIAPNKWDEGEPGIFHKKWYQTWWGKALPFVAGGLGAMVGMPWLGGLAATGVGGAAGYKTGGALGGILGAAGGYGLGGLGAGATGAVRGALGTYGGAATGLKGLAGGFQAGMGGYTAPLRGLLGGTAAVPTDKATSLWDKTMAGLTGAPGGIGAPLAGVTPMLGQLGLGAKGAVPWGQRLTSPGALAGMGLLGASTMGETPEMQTLAQINPELYGQVTSRILGTGGLAQEARGQLGQMVRGTPAEIMAGMGLGAGEEDPFLEKTIGRIEELKEDQIAQINKRAAAAGVFGGGWHREALTSVEEKSAEDITAAQQESSWRLRQIGIELKTSAVADALNLSMTEAQQLMGLLGGEAGIAQQQYASTQAEQDQLRQVLGLTGSELLSKALSPDQFSQLTGLLMNYLRQGQGQMV